MQASRATATRLACIATALMLGACSSGSALTTSSLFGGDKSAADAAPPPQTMADRVVQVATTAARAQRCGFVFDPVGVRQSYIAFEAQQGGAPDQAARAEKSYDYTFGSVSKKIMGEPDYCSDSQTAVIKSDLAKVLAGDYSAPRKKGNVSLFGSRPTDQPMNREKIFDPVVAR